MPEDNVIPTALTLAVTDGLQPGAKLRENRLINVTPTSIEFAGKMSFDQWKMIMAWLRWMRDSQPRFLADSIRYGIANFGIDRASEALAQLEFTQLEVDMAKAIGDLPLFARHASLTAEHDLVLAMAEPKLSPADLEIWKNRAVEHSMSPARLKASIQAGRVIEPSKSGGSRGGGLATPQGIRQAFDLWWRQVDQSDPVARWSIERKRELYEELKPVAKIVQELEEALANEAEDAS